MNATVAPSEERSPRKTVAPGSPGSPRKGGARDKSAQPVVLDVSLRTVEPQEPLFLEENMVRRNLAALDTLFVSPSRRLPWRGAACGGALSAWRHLNCRPCLRGLRCCKRPVGRWASLLPQLAAWSTLTLGRCGVQWASGPCVLCNFGVSAILHGSERAVFSAFLTAFDLAAHPLHQPLLLHGRDGCWPRGEPILLCTQRCLLSVRGASRMADARFRSPRKSHLKSSATCPWLTSRCDDRVGLPLACSC